MVTTANDYISVMVPKEHLTRVYGFIASLDSAVGTEPAPTTSVQVQQEADEPEWTSDLITRQFTESPDSMKAFQKHLADHPGTWFSTTDMAMAQNAERGSKTIAGALGAYGRRVSNRYGMKTWPFEDRWHHVEGQQYYSMTPEVADIINAL